MKMQFSATCRNSQSDRQESIGERYPKSDVDVVVVVGGDVGVEETCGDNDGDGIDVEDGNGGDYYVDGYN